MIIRDLPFHIGAMETPKNPPPLPNTLDFELGIDPESGLLQQVISSEISKTLRMVYSLGYRFGTPLDPDEFGKKYADDFLNFVISNTNGSSLLELGAGTGYLSSLLWNRGYQVTAIEPGNGFEKYWAKYSFPVLKDFFPTNQLREKFSIIVAYGVLEHIENLKDFYSHIKEALVTNGTLIVSVPDCTSEILSCDPSILVHEHISYFTVDSLHASLSTHFSEVVVEKSTFGRTLFAFARNRASDLNRSNLQIQSRISSTKYIELIPKSITRMQNNITNYLNSGNLGVYCPGRAINYLVHSSEIRFFDDDPNLMGKYFPPFDSIIENCQQLISRPVDTLLIVSRTFGETIFARLRKEGYHGDVEVLGL